ncbi:MAG: hypothetical protein JKP98_07620 [Rhodobacteraceae bacterium]|nr:hypothetical protein [Paracoccaceae bacterium]
MRAAPAPPFVILEDDVEFARPMGELPTPLPMQTCCIWGFRVPVASRNWGLSGSLASPWQPAPARAWPGCGR